MIDSDRLISGVRNLNVVCGIPMRTKICKNCGLPIDERKWFCSFRVGNKTEYWHYNCKEDIK